MKIFNNEPFKVITHYDLDGVGGPLLLKHCFGEQMLYPKTCGYGKLTGMIEKNSYKNLIITDLSPTQEQIQLIDELYENVIWFDHHDTSLGVSAPEHWKAFINTKASATKLIYVWLEHCGFDLSHAKAFVDDVNDYDMWIHASPSSILLNNIFWKINFWKFSKAFQNFTWDPVLWKEAKEEEFMKRKIIQEMETYVIEDILRVTVCDKYVSDITLFYPEQEHHVILTGKNKCSIRSSKNLMKFYDQLNELKVYEAGGHHDSGGVGFKGDPMNLIELFYNYVKEL